MTTTLIDTAARNIRFIGCGGTGVNVLRAYREGEPATRGVPRAVEKFSYFDTSPANLAGIASDEAYLIPNADGSGSDRAKNAAAIVAAITPFVLGLNDTPDTAYVIVASTTGGSGSVAAPKLLEKLLGEGCNAVGVLIQGFDTTKHSSNTIGVHAGLQEAVATLDRSIVVKYHQNDPTKSPAANNRIPCMYLNALSILNSGKNSGLDSSDVFNLFNYTKVTHHNPGIAQLEIFDKADDLVAYPHKLVTLGALLKGPDDVVPPVERDHGKVAYLSDNSAPTIEQSLFYGVSIKAMSLIVEDLEKRKKRIIEQRTVVETTAVLGGAEVDKKTNLSFF